MMLLHFLYNALSLVFSNYVKTPILPSAFSETGQLPMVILGAALINFAIALVLLVLFWIYRKLICRKCALDRSIDKEAQANKTRKRMDYLTGGLLIVSVIVIFVIRFL